MKNYAFTEEKTNEVSYTETLIPTKEFCMEGEVLTTLWGGGQGSIDVLNDSWMQDSLKLTKQNIWEHISEKFGCENYERFTGIVFQYFDRIKKYPDGKVYKQKVSNIVFDGSINIEEV